MGQHPDVGSRRFLESLDGGSLPSNERPGLGGGNQQASGDGALQGLLRKWLFHFTLDSFDQLTVNPQKTLDRGRFGVVGLISSAHQNLTDGFRGEGEGLRADVQGYALNV